MAEKVGREAKNGAEAQSIGKCLRFVGNAVQRARGENQTATGIESAKDGAPFFTARGFE